MHGELLVTDNGELLIEQPLHKSRALLIHSDEAVIVCWNDEPSHPPCVPIRPDELGWEVFEWNNHKCGTGRRHSHHDGELFLLIKWHVNSARSIRWQVFEIG